MSAESMALAFVAGSLWISLWNSTAPYCQFNYGICAQRTLLRSPNSLLTTAEASGGIRQRD